MALFRRRKSLFPKLPLAKKHDLRQTLEESELPLKLPPKQDLGKIYTIKKVQKASLLAALALAILTPLTATWLQRQQFDTRSSASQASQPEIQRFVLVDADTGKDHVVISESEASLSLADLPENINLRAEVNGRTVSVRFFVDGVEINTEEKAPYAMAGDDDGTYASWTPVAGTAEIMAIPYSLPNARGVTGPSHILRLTFLDEGESGQETQPSNKPRLTYGDCNGDGVVNVRDMNALKLEVTDGDGTGLDQVASGTFSGSYACDANQDDTVTEADNSCIQSMILGESCQ